MTPARRKAAGVGVGPEVAVTPLGVVRGVVGGGQGCRSACSLGCGPHRSVSNPNPLTGLALSSNPGSGPSRET